MIYSHLFVIIPLEAPSSPFPSGSATSTAKATRGKTDLLARRPPRSFAVTRGSEAIWSRRKEAGNRLIRKGKGARGDAGTPLAGNEHAQPPSLRFQDLFKWATSEERRQKRRVGTGRPRIDGDASLPVVFQAGGAATPGPAEPGRGPGTPRIGAPQNRQIPLNFPTNGNTELVQGADPPSGPVLCLLF